MTHTAATFEPRSRRAFLPNRRPPARARAKPTGPRKPKQSRNITVNDHLYYWREYGPFWHATAEDYASHSPDEIPYLSGVVIWDSESRTRWRVFWPHVAHYEDDLGAYYPIRPMHVAKWIETNLQGATPVKGGLFVSPTEPD